MSRDRRGESQESKEGREGGRRGWGRWEVYGRHRSLFQGVKRKCAVFWDLCVWLRKLSGCEGILPLLTARPYQGKQLSLRPWGFCPPFSGSALFSPPPDKHHSLKWPHKFTKVEVFCMWAMRTETNHKYSFLWHAPDTFRQDSITSRHLSSLPQNLKGCKILDSAVMRFLGYLEVWTSL